jgi:hypothetical protein
MRSLLVRGRAQRDVRGPVEDAVVRLGVVPRSPHRVQARRHLPVNPDRAAFADGCARGRGNAARGSNPHADENVTALPGLPRLADNP